MIEIACIISILMLTCSICYQIYNNISLTKNLKEQHIFIDVIEKDNKSSVDKEDILMYYSCIYKDAICIGNKHSSDMMYFYKKKFYTPDEMYKLTNGNKKS